MKVRASAALLVGLGMELSMATSAHAAPPKPSKTCIAAHEEGQKLRSEKKPHAAHEKFVQCANETCPVVVRKECVDQLAAADKDAPTVALEARDDNGNDTAAVKVSLDGTEVASKLTGVAIDVEPGEHVFKFERDDGKSIEQKVLVVEGEKNRKIAADFSTLVPKKETATPKKEAPPPPAAQGISPVVWIAGGASVLALGSFGFFAIHGKNAEHEVADRCSPHCNDADVTSIHRDYAVADISLGIAAVAAAIAIYFAVATPSEPRPAALPWMPRVRIKP